MAVAAGGLLRTSSQHALTANLEGTHALPTGDDVVAVTVPMRLGWLGTRPRGGRSSRRTREQAGHQLQQFRGPQPGLMKEGVGGHSFRRSEEADFSAHGDHGYLGEALADHGKKLVTRHARHPQVGNDQVGYPSPELPYGIETVLRGAYDVTRRD